MQSNPDDQQPRYTYVVKQILVNMTMDVHQRGLRVETSPPFLSNNPRSSPKETSPNKETNSPPPITNIPVSTATKTTKRSFDVAFLMAPDDLSKKRQQQLRLVTTASLMQRYSSALDVSSVQAFPENTIETLSKSLNNNSRLANMSQENDINHFSESATRFDLLIPSAKAYVKDNRPKEPVEVTRDERHFPFTKSAFTKVNSGRLEVNIVPQVPASPSSVSSTISGDGVSPDITYQESLSPPILTNNSRSPIPYIPAEKLIQPNLPYFANAGKSLHAAINPNTYLYGANTSRDKIETTTRTSPIEQNGGFIGPYLRKSPPLLVDKLHAEPNTKLRAPASLMYPADALPYTGLSVAAYPFPSSFPASAAPVPAHTLLTAAANVTAALLPPSLAALTLPAQNICAKCNISFRMTSDLVYHMRSHHKGDNATVDPARRRREQEKLKCPVCNESFRERHHLTRHMTAHQDKEGDREEDSDTSEPQSKRRSHPGLIPTQSK